MKWSVEVMIKFGKVCSFEIGDVGSIKKKTDSCLDLHQIPVYNTNHVNSKLKSD